VSVLVVDASVAAKWFLPGTGEPLADEAFSLLDRYRADEVRFIVPDLFWAETANVIWKSIRAGRLSRSSGEAAIASLAERNFPSVPSLKLLDRAFEIAVEYQRSVYDCLYVSLAIDSKAQFVTADERLVNALASYFPIKWLGAL
jgi:predicted nucleic acid-binding protein